MSNTVSLDVGGTIFKTSKSTLTKFDGFFKTMLETGIPVPKDDSRAIFIDRDPKYFRLIFNFLRDGDVALPDSPEDVKEIQKEAQFYLMEGLVNLCIMKPKLLKSFNSILVDSDEEISRIARQSKKKAMLVVLHNSNPDEISEEVSEAAMLCGDKIDVCFKSFKKRQGWLYMFHNKINNEIWKKTCFWDISSIIRTFLNNIDQ